MMGAAGGACVRMRADGGPPEIIGAPRRPALSMGAHGGLPFPEALVTANLVADWALSRVVCELSTL